MGSSSRWLVRIPSGVFVGIVVALLLPPSFASAQEIQLTGPLAGAPAGGSGDSRFEPFRFEWAAWLANGPTWGSGGARDATSLAVGAGVEVTSEVNHYEGPPWRRIRPELRMGPWIFGETRAGGQAGALGEGGVTLHLGRVEDTFRPFRSFAMFDVRLGGGYSDYGFAQTPHGMGAIAIGYRTVPERDRSKARSAHGEASDAAFFRLVLIHRKAIAFDASEYALVFEVTPLAFARVRS